MPGDEHDRGVIIRARELGLKIEAAGSRQSYVQDDAIGCARLAAFQKLFNRSEKVGFQRDRLEQALQCLPDSLIVVDDGDHGARFFHSAVLS